VKEAKSDKRNYRIIEHIGNGSGFSQKEYQNKTGHQKLDDQSPLIPSFHAVENRLIFKNNSY
jgi:hypothetical protein